MPEARHEPERGAGRGRENALDSASDAPSEEHELRVLLERAVPQLPTPAQRLGSVRERMRRRRRRRTAGLSATAVLAVAAAGLLVPRLDGAASAPPPAPGSITFAPPASGTAPTAPTPSAEPTTQPPYVREQFAKAGGLRLRLPQGWTALDPPGGTAVYVSTQPLGLPAGACNRPLDGFCTPLVQRLGRDGVLIQFTLWAAKGLAGQVRHTGADVGRQSVFTACRAVGGTEQLGASIPVPAGTGAGAAPDAGHGFVIEATACLALPSPAREAQTRAVLTTADFH